VAGRGEGFRIRDAKPPRSAEAGQDSFPWPTTPSRRANQSFCGASVKKLARIVYDGSHKIGEELARTLIEAAAESVGSYHSEPYRLRIKYLCEDLDVLRRRLKDLVRDIERKLDDHEVGKLLTTIDGSGP
jgi:transposase